MTAPVFLHSRREDGYFLIVSLRPIFLSSSSLLYLLLRTLPPYLPLLVTFFLPSMPNIGVDIHGVYKLLSNIKPVKASGPDSIPHCVKRSWSRARTGTYGRTFSNHLLSLPRFPQTGRLDMLCLSLRKGILIVQITITISLLLVYVANSSNALYTTISETTLTTITSYLCFNTDSCLVITVTLSCSLFFMTLCLYSIPNVRSMSWGLIFRKPLKLFHTGGFLGKNPIKKREKNIHLTKGSSLPNYVMAFRREANRPLYRSVMT